VLDAELLVLVLVVLTLVDEVLVLVEMILVDEEVLVLVELTLVVLVLVELTLVEVVEVVVATGPLLVPGMHWTAMFVSDLRSLPLPCPPRSRGKFARWVALTVPVVIVHAERASDAGRGPGVADTAALAVQGNIGGLHARRGE